MTMKLLHLYRNFVCLLLIVYKYTADTVLFVSHSSFVKNICPPQLETIVLVRLKGICQLFIFISFCYLPPS